ncbi:transketolase [Candidatus Merdisoma sp. JLR.KK006]|uniref:transketolase n=1 Tax=Candidatus Merdisoma sp. JLR.KK006 TaxID=3112626 RepID=UPI002FEE903A
MRLEYTAEQLEAIAHDIRVDVIESLHCAGSGHPGGSLSIAEIMSVLYFHEMNLDPANPNWEERDRFVLSKGHAAPAYYAALAERGYFSKELLKTLRQIDSPLQGHPDRKKAVGVDMSTGSLGQGISAAAGMACFAKRSSKDFRVYCVLGDGEMQEGEVWEALMAAAHYKLSNFTVLLDNNNLQIDGQVRDVMSVYPIREKVEAFGWKVLEAGGHDVKALCSALKKARENTETPTFIICKTVKGKGVSFMENQAGWHGAAVTDENYETAMKELNA